MDFWGNVGANLIGTFVGAALALGGAAWISKHEQKARDRRLLQSVIERLWRVRALRPGRIAPIAWTSAVKEDRKRCTKSVITTRNLIARVNDELTLRSRGSVQLDAMYGACLRYLNTVEADPTGYVETLMSLRADLQREVDDLKVKDGKLQPRIVGSHDLSNRNEQTGAEWPTAT